MTPIESAILLLVALIAAASATVINDVGSVQLLFQNDLVETTTSTSALLLKDLDSYDNALTKCLALSENLLNEVPADIQDQLTYLVYSGQLDNNARLFIGASNAQGWARQVKHQEQSCFAYSLASASVVKMDCSAELLALCTQSAPAYKKQQLGHRFSGDEKLTIQTDKYNVTGYVSSFPFWTCPNIQASTAEYPGIAIHDHFVFLRFRLHSRRWETCASHLRSHIQATLLSMHWSRERRAFKPLRPMELFPPMKPARIV